MQARLRGGGINQPAAGFARSTRHAHGRRSDVRAIRTPTRRAIDIAPIRRQGHGAHAADVVTQGRSPGTARHVSAIGCDGDDTALPHIRAIGTPPWGPIDVTAIGCQLRMLLHDPTCCVYQRTDFGERPRPREAQLVTKLFNAHGSCRPAPPERCATQNWHTNRACHAVAPANAWRVPSIAQSTPGLANTTQ
jgi:hypothetical protein